MDKASALDRPVAFLASSSARDKLYRLVQSLAKTLTFVAEGTDTKELLTTVEGRFSVARSLLRCTNPMAAFNGIISQLKEEDTFRLLIGLAQKMCGFLYFVPDITSTLIKLKLLRHSNPKLVAWWANLFWTLSLVAGIILHVHKLLLTWLHLELHSDALARFRKAQEKTTGKLLQATTPERKEKLHSRLQTIATEHQALLASRAGVSAGALPVVLGLARFLFDLPTGVNNWIEANWSTGILGPMACFSSLIAVYEHWPVLMK